jgi:hypothetical protein
VLGQSYPISISDHGTHQQQTVLEFKELFRDRRKFPCSQFLSQLMVSRNIELVSLHERVRKLKEILLSNAESSPNGEVKKFDKPSEPSVRVVEPALRPPAYTSSQNYEPDDPKGNELKRSAEVLETTVLGGISTRLGEDGTDTRVSSAPCPISFDVT